MTISINTQIDKVQRKVQEVLETIPKAVALSTATYINSYVGSSGYGSPVWTGRYTDSHRISLNTPDRSREPQRNRLVPPREGSLTNSYVSSVLAGFKLGDTIHMTNSTPYASEIEYEGTKTAPRGVYRVAVDSAKVRYSASIDGLIRATNGI